MFHILLDTLLNLLIADSILGFVIGNVVVFILLLRMSRRPPTVATVRQELLHE
jgi:hypothetical protein